ncbi:MAG: Heme A synthase [Alphaproteobacteria bacterium MarineAlpha5_Bin8]|nr:MAG: Heme A synthase [Alphaproteobacteria bacterium MarineAlpha5_Bin8]PPR45631.1 MAG: Heme A synthase [Alphaproteobacteria bacterium MarineAlpha5_Bin7]|tara:strand:- start:4698 stop:5729 length:1032 start_codon:yes stop_codon:yes gene_type:complete
MNSIKEKSLGISIWLFSLTIMTFLIIIIGGLTRLTESGLSMVDWRPLMGIFPPFTEESWKILFQNYQKTPEYQIVNKNMSINDFKFIFWWEWFHRFFARCIGIVFIFPFIYFAFKKKISARLFLTLLLVFIFGIFQAIVGWWMVKSGLSDNPYVSSYRLAFHLTNALIIFSILFWATLNSYFSKIPNDQLNNSIFIFFNLGIFFLFITIISGAFMAGTHAGNSFNTFPFMNGKLIPEGYYINEYKFLNIFENTIAINFNHRWLASFTFLYIFIINLYLFIISKNNNIKFALMLVIIFISVQFLLGILTLIYNVPILLASMHQTNSVILLASMLYSYFCFKYKN